MKLLSVDFDFFFQENHMDDWSHNEENPFLHEAVWSFRAADFLSWDKPLPGLSGDQLNFWGRFRFTKNTELFYADSHAMIARAELLYGGITEIWNFDAHHDAYQTIGQVCEQPVITCDNWATYLSMCASIHSVIPAWDKKNLYADKPKVHITRMVDYPHNYRLVFDRIFVCRSSCWVPSWLEDGFWKFIADCPVEHKINVDGMTPRQFSLEDANVIADQIRKIRNDHINSARMPDVR